MLPRTRCAGAQNLAEAELHLNYTTVCDPRLNYAQSMEVAAARVWRRLWSDP